MRLVVIGGVAAGMSAAARARRCDSSLDIIVLEKGPAVAWGACGLPYYLEGQVKSLDELIVHTPEYFANERNISVRTGTEVTAVEHARRQVVLSTGECVPYDRLILATGARPARSLESAGHPNVFTLATFEDARRMRCFLKERKPRTAVIVGAGYQGLELAEALRMHGVAVTILEATAGVLGRQDPALTDALRKHLERFHVALRLDTRVESVEPDSVAGVPCEMVVVAAGWRPNVELAGEAGIHLGRSGAVRVSDRMETNLAGIYAAGDCAETTHLVTGRAVYLPLGTTANKMGRVAGANAAGRRERFPGVAGTFIVRVCGMGIAVTGLSAAQARQEGFDPVEARIEALERPRYFRGAACSVSLVADRQSGRLVGGAVIAERGAAGRINVLATALAARMRVEDLERLDLAYAPPFSAVWDPILIAAQQLVKSL